MWTASSSCLKALIFFLSGTHLDAARGTFADRIHKNCQELCCLLHEVLSRQPFSHLYFALRVLQVLRSELQELVFTCRKPMFVHNWSVPLTPPTCQDFSGDDSSVAKCYCWPPSKASGMTDKRPISFSASFLRDSRSATKSSSSWQS